MNIRILQLVFPLLLLFNIFNGIIKISSSEIDTNCSISVSEWRNLTYPNQYLMISSSGYGLFDLGDYPNCISLTNPNREYLSQYCIMENSEPLLIIALCLPLKCSENEIIHNRNILLGPIILAARPELSLFLNSMKSESASRSTSANITVTCYSDTKNNNFFTNTDSAGILFFILICSIISIVIISTVLDYYRNHQQSNSYEKDELLLPKLTINDNERGSVELIKSPKSEYIFSLISNCNRLFASNRNLYGYDINCLNGIRTISILWIILCHTIEFTVGLSNPRPPGLSTNYINNIVTQRLSTQIIINGDFSVNSFFYLSGFLCTFILLKEIKNLQSSSSVSGSGSNNSNIKNLLFKYYIGRYLRLTPTFFFWLLFFWKISPFLSTGPLNAFKKITISRDENCDNYWWTGLLYISNFYPGPNKYLCAGWYWYLNVDFQLYLFVPIFTLLFAKRPIYGWISLLVSISTCWLTMSLTHYYDKRPDNENRYPYYYFPIYAFGISTAWIIDQSPFKPLIQSQIPYIKSWIHRLILSIVGFSLMLFILFIPYNCYYPSVQIQNHHLNINLATSATDAECPWSKSSIILHQVFKNSIWGLGIGIIVLCCITVNKDKDSFILLLLNWILSLPIFNVLAKITYSTYCIHVIIMYIFILNNNDWLIYNDSTIILNFIGYTILSLLLGIISFLFLEQPISNIFSKLLKKKGKSI